MSFLPESDVDRIVDYAVASGKRSFAALLSEGAYGNVVEAEFKQAVARKGGRIVALERYPLDASRDAGGRRGGSRRPRAAPMPCSFRTAPDVVPRRAGADRGRPRHSSACSSSAPDCGTIRASSTTRGSKAAGTPRPTRQASAISPRAIAPRYNQEPVRTATLAYDAVALVAALVKTQGPQRFTEQTLTNASGFAGIDGVFRFRAGRHQRARPCRAAGRAGRRPGRQPARRSRLRAELKSRQAQHVHHRIKPGARPRAQSAA